MATTIFNLKRVSYGKSSTPDKFKEYTVTEFQNSAVGSIEEIVDFIKNDMSLKKFALKIQGKLHKFNFED